MGRPSRGGQRAGTGAAVSREATLIRGDGIGPEIVDAVLRVLDAAGAEFDWDEQLAGVSALEEAGTPLPDATLESLRLTRLGLKGPLTTPVGSGFRSVNVALRKEFDLYANVRPAKTVLSGGKANPSALLLAACMMLDYLEERERADHIRAALLSTIRDDNVRTPDLGGDASTMGFADAVSRRLA